MSIANVLIRPQVLDRRPADDEAVALDLLTGLGSRLLADFLKGGPASKKIADASQAGVEQFVHGFEPRLETARTKLLEWADPYLSIIEGVTEGLGSDTGENLLAVAESLIALTNKLLDDLHSANIADRLNALADILEEDLGISWNSFEAFFDGIFDSVTTALEHEMLQGIQSEEAINNFLIARQLLTLRRVAKEQLNRVPLPTFDRRALIRQWQLELEASNWDETLDAIQDKLNKGPEQLGKILPLLTRSFSLSVGVGVSAGPGRSFRDTSAPGQYSWYASWFRGEGTGVKDRFDLSGEPFIGEMHFTDALSEKFLENWALITAALEEAARALKYGFDLDNGNKISPALNLGWQSAMGVMTLLSYLVDGEEWVSFYSVKNSTPFQKGVPAALTFGGSFEQFPGFWGWLWATSLHDFGNMSSGMTWPKLAREGLLSLFTLINANDNANTKNHEKIGGITSASRIGGAYIAAVIMGRKDRYYSIFSDSFGLSLLVILGGGVITFAFDVIGWLIAGAFSRRISMRYWKFENDGFGSGTAEFFGGENAWGSLFWSFIDFYTTWGGFWEGKSNDGKFGLKNKLLENGRTEKVDATFNGYPAKAESPYRLPFGPDRLVFCPQGHHGFSGHNYRKGLVYAVDFLLKEGELALAMRDGTVVEYQDDRRNGSDEGLNYIVIRHDTPDAVHDLGEGGAATTTYARYEHANPYGIRQAFAMMGIPESHIIGTKVQAGFPLIRVGKRPGFFNFDYLQVQVTGATTDSLLPTIPFVFRDVPGNGVPKKGIYYTSTNKLKAPINLSQLHPGVAAGWVVESGTDFVKIQLTGSDKDDFYKDAHIVVWYDLDGCAPWYEYQKIKAYHGEERKVTIDGSWLAGHPPPPDARYRISGQSYSKADAIDKHFAYLANRDSGGTAQPFPDGHDVYKIVNTAYYQPPAVSGLIVDGGIAGTSEVQLDAHATGAEHEYIFRHIIIKRSGEILQYRLIKEFKVELGIPKITIHGVWDMDLKSVPLPDSYEIGAAPYWQPGSVKILPYHGPDRSLDHYEPDKFRDGANLSRYHTVRSGDTTT